LLSQGRQIAGVSVKRRFPRRHKALVDLEKRRLPVIDERNVDGPDQLYCRPVSKRIATA
jgi:hypothetical protein